MDLKYRITQEFLRIEALGTVGSRYGDLSDPLILNPVVTYATDLTRIVEQAWSNDLNYKNKVYKLSTGLWAFQVDPALYMPGVKYCINFRYEMTPNNLNVARKQFVWNPVPSQPHDCKSCVVYGTLTDTAGAPASDERLVIERYKDVATLNVRTHQATVTTDAFGIWNFELPQGTIARFVFGDISKVVQVPLLENASLASIPEYQPLSARVDMFGYPFPAGV